MMKNRQRESAESEEREEGLGLLSIVDISERTNAYFFWDPGDQNILMLIVIDDKPFFLDSFERGFFEYESEMKQWAKWKVDESDILLHTCPEWDSPDEEPGFTGPAYSGIDFRGKTVTQLNRQLDQIADERLRWVRKKEILDESRIQHLKERGDYFAEIAEAEGQAKMELARRVIAAYDELERLALIRTDEVLEELPRVWREMYEALPTERQPNVFHKGAGGDFWIRFQGREYIELPYSKGLDCIHRLLEAYNQHGSAQFLLWELEREHPMPEITIEDVAGEKGIVIPGFGDEEPVDDGGPQDAKRTGDEKMDKMAAAAALERIEEIDAEIKERKREIGKTLRWGGDPKDAAAVDIDAENAAIRGLRKEKKKIQALLKKDTAIFGRSREFTTPEVKVADGIRKNISYARGSITKKDLVLGEHFKCIYIDSKVYISYRPKERIYWDTG